ncbi:hypothetical protein [Actinotalea sp.]|uniref:hypothetical protein n=1 Tax=Actinotalea sp. TaxID=1872145 RepID=UPI003562409C
MTGGIRRINADGTLGRVEPASSEVRAAEARAAALRAQALRAQAEREEAARRGVERGQAQRAAIQRADAERAAQERAQRFAEQVAAQAQSPAALPVAEVEDSGPGTATPLVSTRSEAPTAAGGSVPSASEAEREARERADEIARARDAAVAQQRAAQVELERQARENILRAERERGAARPGARAGAAVGGAVSAEQPVPAPRWGSVSESVAGQAAIADPQEGPGAPGTGPEARAAAAASAAESAPVPIPRWSSVVGTGEAEPPARAVPADEQSGPVPVPSAAGSTPAPAPRWVPSVGSRAGTDVSPAWPVPGEGSTPQGAAGSTGRQESGADESDDEPGEQPARVYTWMHIIALAVVAFVLGMLIVMVLLQDNSQSVPATSEAVRATLVDPGSLGVLHLLSTGI